MTVRTWLTISALALAALTTAFVLRVVMPLQAPALLATVGSVRLEGRYLGSCWPQRNGRLRCERPKPPELNVLGHRRDVPAVGKLRVIAAYPVQPSTGSIRIKPISGDADEPFVVDQPWTTALNYHVTSDDRYWVEAVARYPGGAYIRYEFWFSVR